MMAQKHLHELLQEDQEPFLLQNYISDRKSLLTKSMVTKSSLQPKKRKSLSDNSHSLYKQACFLSFQNSPDLRKSPCRIPYKSPNDVILHIPARTAALLLESALRIQKQSSAKKPRTQIRNVGLGLFGSIFRRLNSKNQTRNCEIGGDEPRDFAIKSGGKGKKLNENVVSVEGESPAGRGFSCSCNDNNSRRNGSAWSARKWVGKGEKSKGNVDDVEDESPTEMGFSCNCNTSRRTSTIWSESNEEKSVDLESSTSSRSDEFEETENGAFGFCENRFCSSPLSPFRFSLETSPSPVRRTPVFLSPATSPSHLKKQDKVNYEVVERIVQVEEEEKEQFSPVSVLDPPFVDDDGEEEEGSYHLECSYAMVQRAKLQLLHKLSRFERLAELDPIELEQRMFEERDDEYDSEHPEEEEEEEEKFEEAESVSCYTEKNAFDFVGEVVSELGFHFSKVPADMRRLVSDLIAEEKREEEEDGELVVKRVLKRLESWKGEKSNTIDMMVELEFRREIDGWKRSDKEQMREAAMEIEISIFEILVKELSEDFNGESS